MQAVISLVPVLYKNFRIFPFQKVFVFLWKNHLKKKDQRVNTGQQERSKSSGTMFCGQVIEKDKETQFNEHKWQKQSSWSNSTGYLVLTSVEVHACTGVSEVWNRPVRQIYVACIGGGGRACLQING